MTRPKSPDLSSPLPSPTRRNWIWLSFQVVLRVLLTIWLRYRARGVENVPAEGGGLLLINHQSFLDPILVGLPLRRPVSFLARDSLFRVPVIGWIFRKTYVMPISREAATSGSIKEAVRRMQHGFLVGVFPEGTRTADGAVGELKPGFVALVRRVRLPIYPVGIAGAHAALPRHGWWLKPTKVCIVFGEPLPSEEIERLSRRGREEELVAAVRERIIACAKEAESWRNQTFLGRSRPDGPASSTSDRQAAVHGEDRPGAVTRGR